MKIEELEEAVHGGRIRILRGFDEDIATGYFECFDCNRVWQYFFGADIEDELLSIILRQNLQTHIDSGHMEFFGAKEKN